MEYAYIMIIKQATQAMHMPCYDNVFQNIYYGHLGMQNKTQPLRQPHN